MQTTLVRNPTMALLGQVFGLVGLAFGVTAITGYFCKDLSPGVALIVMPCSLVMIVGMGLARRYETLALLFYYGMAACMGAGLGPLIGQYAHIGKTDVVVEAAGFTALGMAVMGILAWTSSFDFRRIEGIGLMGLGLLVIAGLIGMFVHYVNPTIYAWATLGIFAILVPADFARIRAGGDGQSPIELATSIYLDALNMFLAILRLLGSSSSSSKSS